MINKSENKKFNKIILLVVLSISILYLIIWFLSLFDISFPFLKNQVNEPGSTFIFSILSVLFLLRLRFKYSQIIKKAEQIILYIVISFCSITFIAHMLHSTETIYNPDIKKIIGYPIWSMSEITSLLLLAICLGFIGVKHKIEKFFFLFSESITLLTFLISSTLFVEYFYSGFISFRGNNFQIPILSSINLILLCIVLLEEFKSTYKANIIIYNRKPTRILLLNTFLPIIISIVLLNGILLIDISQTNFNHLLSEIIIFLILTVYTVYLIVSISKILGGKIEKSEESRNDIYNKFQELSKNTNGFISYFNAKTLRYEFVNDYYEKSLGTSKEKIIGKHIRDIIDEENYQFVLKYINEVRNGKSVVYENTYKLSSGTRWIESNMIPVKDNNNHVTSIAVIAFDITEKKRLLNEIKQSHLLLNSSIESQKNSNIRSIDKDYKLLLFNNTYWETINTLYDTDIKPGMNLLDCIPLEPDRLATKMNFDRAFAGESHSNIRKYGKFQKKFYENFYYPIINEKNEIIGATAFSHDITEREKAELKLKKSYEKISRMNADKDRFISILSHDFKSPLSTIAGFSELLTRNIRQYDIDKIEDMANRIHKSTHIAIDLLKDLLLWSNTQSGKIKLYPKSYYLKDIYQDILKTLNPQAELKEIEISFIADHEITILCDRDMLLVVLRNLVSNAIKFTEKRGVIKINAVTESTNTIISVIDNGVGISPENLTKLFDIREFFTRIGTNKEKGTGLGLLLCKELIEKHKGKIWAESAPGIGSTFHFTLPKIST